MSATAAQRAPQSPPPAPPGRAKPVIQSVDRAFDILEALAHAAGKLSLAELSDRVGLNLSTCHHLVATIARRGYVTQDRATRQYALSSKIFELSDARTRQIDLVDIAMPFLERLNRATGEAVHLAVIEGTDLTTIARLAAQHAVRVESSLGKSNAAHATALGKAILAWLPEGELDAILAAKGMVRFTPATIAGREALIEALRLVRRYGYAEDREEFQPNVCCIGGSIRGHKGSVVGAVGVSLPMMRASGPAVAAIRAAVTEAARGISRELGARTAGASDDTRPAFTRSVAP
jgi:IclR family transcriptional regulator, acetate operon repressor